MDVKLCNPIGVDVIVMNWDVKGEQGLEAKCIGVNFETQEIVVDIFDVDGNGIVVPFGDIQFKQ